MNAPVTSEKKNLKEKLLPTLDSAETAKKLAKNGGIAGFIFMAMQIAGLAAAVYFNRDPVTGEGASEEVIMYQMVGTMIAAPVLFLMSFRVMSGKGYISAGLLLVLFIAEICTKVVNGTTNAGWFLFYFFMAGMFANAIRGCWYLKNIDKQAVQSNG